MLSKLVAILLITVLLYSNQVTATAECHDIAPGVVRMSRGVDITRFDSKPPKISHDDGYRAQLFDITCHRKRTFRHPNNRSLVYQIPDHIGAINTVPSSHRSVVTSVTHSLKEYKLALGAVLGLNASVAIIGSFSRSDGYKHAQKSIEQSSKFILELSSEISSTEVSLKLQPKPSEEFCAFVNQKLVSLFEDDPQVYDDFIDHYGTHYFQRAYLGGKICQKIEAAIEEVYRVSAHEVLHKAKTNFEQLMHGTLSLGGQSAFKLKIDSRDYQSEFSGTIETSYYGGDSDFREQLFSAWYQTVHQNPWIYRGQLVPLENLIQNATIKLELRKAILVRRIKALLEDLRETLTLGKVKLSQSDQQQLRHIESNITNFKLNESAFGQMGLKLDQMFDMVQLIKVRAEFFKYLTDLRSLWKKVIECKWQLAHVSPNSIAKEQIDRELTEYQKLKRQMSRVDYTRATDVKQMSSLIGEAAKMITHHENKVVPICASNNRRCLAHRNIAADEWNSKGLTCTTATEWKVIGYAAQKWSTATVFGQKIPIDPAFYGKPVFDLFVSYIPFVAPSCSKLKADLCSSVTLMANLDDLDLEQALDNGEQARLEMFALAEQRSIQARWAKVVFTNVAIAMVLTLGTLMALQMYQIERYEQKTLYAFALTFGVSIMVVAIVKCHPIDLTECILPCINSNVACFAMSSSVLLISGVEVYAELIGNRVLCVVCTSIFTLLIVAIQVCVTQFIVNVHLYFPDFQMYRELIILASVALYLPCAFMTAFIEHLLYLQHK